MKKYKVFLSPVAEKKLILLVDYLEKEWGIKVKKDFLKELQKSIKKIEQFPKSCPESILWKGIFKNVVNKQTSFYYRIQQHEIEVLTITDNRQDPKKIFKEVEKLQATE